MKPEISQYVIRHYGFLMTQNEKFVNKQLQLVLKRVDGPTSQEETKHQRIFLSLQTGPPEILELSKGGFESFVERTAERILADHNDAVILNYCPHCQKLARTPRTPRAQQCRFCGHDWHTVSTAE